MKFYYFRKKVKRESYSYYYKGNVKFYLTTQVKKSVCRKFVLQMHDHLIYLIIVKKNKFKSK